MEKALFAFAFLGFMISTFGWGRAVCRLTRSGAKTYPGYCIALGISAWIFLGGLLNFLHLARIESLYFIYFSGIFLSAGCFFRISSADSKFDEAVKSTTSVTPAEAGARPPFFLYAIPFFAAVFLIYTSIPAGALNFHDDFHTYLPRLARMIQTGTVGGNPFELLGFDSLGSQTFLQSFITARFPFDYVFGFDAIFCFITGMMLIIEMSHKLRVHWLHALLALLVYAGIDPVIVNTSSVYSGSLMIIGMVFSLMLISEDARDDSSRAAIFRRVVPFSLFLASLMSLKMSLAVFGVLYFLIYCAVLLYQSGHARRTFRFIFPSMLATTLFTLPWILISLPNYLSLFSGHADSKKIALAEISLRTDFAKHLFSVEKFYGGISYFHFNFVVFVFLFILLLSMHLPFSKRGGSTHNDQLIAVSCTAGISSYILLGILFVNFGFVPRYAIPILIGLLPPILMLIQGPVLQKKTSAKRFLQTAAPVICAAVFLLFGNSLLFRTRQLVQHHAPLYYPINQDQVRFKSAVLGRDNQYRDWIRQLQGKTRKNEIILSWLSESFYLDHNRNTVYTFAKPEMVKQSIPYGSPAEDLQKYLKKMGIKYIIWGFNEPTMKTAGEYQRMIASLYPQERLIGEYGLYLIDSLKQVIARGRVIHNDGRIIVAEI